MPLRETAFGLTETEKRSSKLSWHIMLFKLSVLIISQLVFFTKPQCRLPARRIYILGFRFPVSSKNMNERDEREKRKNERKE